MDWRSGFGLRGRISLGFVKGPLHEPCNSSARRVRVTLPYPPQILDHCTDAVASEGAGLMASSCVECAVCVRVYEAPRARSAGLTHAVTYQKVMTHK